MSGISRRELLRTAAIFAAGAAASGCGVLANSRSSALFASLPHADDYMPVITALTETLLPFSHPDFALEPQDVERRLLEYFPLDDAAEYANLRRALVYFGDVRLEPHLAAPIVSAERELLEAARAPDPGRELDQRVELEQRAAPQQRFSAPAFVALDAHERARYLQSWATSQLVIKRRFYRGTKSMVMIAAYSLEASWRAIGYEGPLLEKA